MNRVTTNCSTGAAEWPPVSKVRARLPASDTTRRGRWTKFVVTAFMRSSSWERPGAITRGPDESGHYELLDRCGRMATGVQGEGPLARQRHDAQGALDQVRSDRIHAVF